MDRSHEERAGADLPLATRLRRRADRLEQLILHNQLPDVDVEIEVAALRRMVEEEAPERLPLFEHPYVSRFQRLRLQWQEDRDIGKSKFED